MKKLPVSLLVLLILNCVPAAFAEDKSLTYEGDVRPILKAHCFQCHGEAGEKSGGLDVRLRRFLAQGGESGPAIVEGRPGESLMLARIVAGEMPPEDKPLNEREIDVLRRWIAQGAPTAEPEPAEVDESYVTRQEREFWAFQPIRRPSLPAAASGDISGGSAVDLFIAARLQQAKLTFSAEASRETLIRRLYFDLLGVPPHPSAVQAFVADESPAAYSELLDRLLASPAYGERWGRHWLDIAGYADSEGYVDADPTREWAYSYRDYVIRAFNEDMPFDQFVIEQLAGDELVSQPYSDLSPDQIRQLTATGFLRMAPDGTGRGGVDESVARNEMIADTINIVGTSLLGLTVGCARCHNHRYDPISQQDYYRLRAIFAPALDWKSWRTPTARRVSLYTDADRKLAAQIEQKAKVAQDNRQQILDGHLQRTLKEELIKAPDDLKAALRTAYETAKDKRTAEQIALLKEYPNIQNISSGSLYLYSEQRVRRANEIADVANKKEAALVEKVRAEHLQAAPAEHREALEAAAAMPQDKRTEPQQKLIAEHPGVSCDATTLEQFDPDGARFIAELRAAAEVCRNTDSKKQLADLQDAVKQIRDTIPKEHFIRALTEPPDHQPETVVFLRGSHNLPGDKVTPGELQVLAADQTAAIAANDSSLSTSGRRLAYARHLTDGRHPLLARVIVNRIWLHHFGRGLVNSPGDFGMLGERPSHPLLLDWLAQELMDGGWHIKRLHRLILTSSTYRQASVRSELLDTIDPDNRLYGRQTIRRIESEVLRDAVLEVSGLAQHEMFGPPIPVMEDSVGQIVIGKEDLDGERKPRSGGGLGGTEHRRSIYVQLRRTRRLAVLETFDVPTVAPNCTMRPASNVSSQALLLMNSDFMQRYARAFGKRAELEGGDDLVSQLRYAWQLAYGEQPQDEQVAALESFVAEQVQQLQEQDDKLDANAARSQAIATACQALLGANRFIYVD